MITFPCESCAKPLEVDNDLSGQKVRCPFCKTINTAKVDHVPVARAASGPAPGPGSEPELVALRVHPAVLRGRPVAGALLVIGILSAISGAGWLGWYSNAWWWLPASVAVVGLTVWGVWAVHSRGTVLTITNKRVRLRRGLLSKATREVPLEKIQDLQIDQVFWQRVLGIGTIGISSSGEEGVEIEVHGVPRPERIRAVIDRSRTA